MQKIVFIFKTTFYINFKFVGEIDFEPHLNRTTFYYLNFDCALNEVKVCHTFVVFMKYDYLGVWI
jgi:hypothetical protein